MKTAACVVLQTGEVSQRLELQYCCTVVVVLVQWNQMHSQQNNRVKINFVALLIKGKEGGEKNGVMVHRYQ